MYHRFVGRDELGRQHHSQEILEAQLDYIGRNHKVFSSGQHLFSLQNGTPIAGAPVVFTIDDGYRDFFDLIFPLLSERQWPATFFTTTGFVDGSTWFWWDKLHYVLRNAPGRRFVRKVGDVGVEMDLTTLEGRLEAWDKVSDVLRWLSAEDNLLEIAKLATSFEITIPEETPEEYAAVNWDHVLEIYVSGIGLGGHTVTHHILARLTPQHSR